jgi:hypothetical protein
LTAYLQSDAEPAADTFIGFAQPAPADPVALARAARDAIRALDGTLPDQPLAVTIGRAGGAAIAVPSSLDVAAFAIGDRCWSARLDDLEPGADLSRVLRPLAQLPTPFVCVTLGDEPVETARHGHRRAWHGSQGPWLGLSRAGGMMIVSTCHMIVDGYGHALLASRVGVSVTVSVSGPRQPLTPTLTPTPTFLPMAWREVQRPLRALPLAYATGRLLHRGGRASPAIQIPVAPRELSRRVVPALARVRFEAGQPEPFARFEQRTRAAIARETSGSGLVSLLLATARAAPAPLAWKRRALAAERPRWLAPVADMLGGRACVSRIRIDRPLPPACAVSSPAQPDGLVITVVDDGTRAALTVCGKDASAGLLDELLALLP